MSFLKRIIARDSNNDKEVRKVKFTRSMQQQLKQIIDELSKFNNFDTIECVKTSHPQYKLYSKWNTFIEEIKIFCEAWNQKENVRTSFERANNILASYYENGKILDYLERVNRYVDDLVDDEDPILAFDACYNNYIYFLSHFMNDLKEKNQPQNDSTSACALTDQITNQWIVEHECCKLIFISKIKGIIHTAKLLGSKGIQQTFSVEDEKTFRRLTAFAEEYSTGSTGYENYIDEDISSVNNQTEQLKRQISRMEEEIQKSEKLYNLLLDTLSEEWFERMTPKRIERSFETSTELKEYLIQAMGEINEKILNVYPRV